MTITRRYYCRCSGRPVELVPIETTEEEWGEAACEHCGATPSSDPKKTVSYRDVEAWED